MSGFKFDERALRREMEGAVRKAGAELLADVTRSVNSRASGKSHAEAKRILESELAKHGVEIDGPEISRLAQTLAEGGKITLAPSSGPVRWQ